MTMQWIQDLFEKAQQGLFEIAVQPILFSFGLGNFLEDGYTATGWLLVGLIQIAVLLAIIGPLQRWRPVEPLVDARAVRTDVLYTLLHRLGLFRVALFFSVEPLFDDLFGMLRVAGLGTVHIDQVVAGVTDHPFISFVIYLVVFDFVDYWIHRGQHGLNWWWSLHSLHHSQRQMTMWSDNRNHLLDDLLRDSLLVVVGQLIGVGPGQFVAIVAIAQLSESLQHANLRLHFGRIGERLWISPRFHRLHHSIGIGHERNASGELLREGRSPALGGHNFGVLLPWWDVLFRTANFELRWDPTGVRDQVEQGRDYGRGFWSQQWLGVLRLVGKA
ncbi:MAG: putative rane protein [Ramlibacter sp.]|jgi:sterol desaturase/sphingolipid hydroxylase (fatty acid hydroxylase superfamily)|nr:putative rane protein [Ramlibacter sp.]MCE3270615.1 putative rane protein [Ramlibacter sp.]